MSPNHVLKYPKCVQTQKGQYLFISGAFWAIWKHNNSLISKSKVKSKICQQQILDRNHVAAYTGHQVQFWSGFAIFDILEGTTDVSKIAKPCQNCTWWPVQAAEYFCNFFRKSYFFPQKIRKNPKKIVKIPKKIKKKLVLCIV